MLEKIAVRSSPRIKSFPSIGVDWVQAGLHRQPMIQSRVVLRADQGSESANTFNLAEVGSGYPAMVSKLLPIAGCSGCSGLLGRLQDGHRDVVLGAFDGAQRFAAEDTGRSKKADRPAKGIRKERCPERQVKNLHCANRGSTAKDREDYNHSQHFLPDLSSADN